ncbi:hypothetical protein P4657_03915, partial [Halalkalibacterium halodurans]|uniref:hypothetical protein n=1 Tax=Halalkalibacterium halodurans TaxID=86665 RepID=UPI0030C9E462
PYSLASSIQTSDIRGRIRGARPPMPPQHLTKNLSFMKKGRKAIVNTSFLQIDQKLCEKEGKNALPN